MGDDPFFAAPARHKLTIEVFLALDRSGAFNSGGRFELIEGEIFKMSPMRRRHARALIQVGGALRETIAAAALELEVLSPISTQFDDHSLPEPDLVVATIEDSDFVRGDSVRLVVEVADTSLRHDLGRKARLYARHAIPEYWVVDLQGNQIHRMSEPTTQGYCVKDIIPFGERLASAALPGIAIDTAALG